MWREQRVLEASSPGGEGRAECLALSSANQKKIQDHPAAATQLRGEQTAGPRISDMQSTGNSRGKRGGRIDLT